MTDDIVDINRKFALFSVLWSPKLVARVNDSEVKLVKLKGEFVWHTHEHTDELYSLIEGQLTTRLRDRDVVLGPGQLFVVPRGVERCPCAAPAACMCARAWSIDACHDGFPAAPEITPALIQEVRGNRQFLAVAPAMSPSARAARQEGGQRPGLAGRLWLCHPRPDRSRPGSTPGSEDW